VFWTHRFETLKGGLEGLGYEVSDKGDRRRDVWDVAGWWSFIPFIGILFGMNAIVAGLASHTWRGTARAAVGVAGIVFNALLLVLVL